MIEEFDAIQSLDLTGLFVLVVGMLMLGILLEVGIHFGRRWAIAKGLIWLPAILGALVGQLLFWTLLLGVAPSLLALTGNITGWEPRPGLVQMLLSISITVFIVRLINGLLRILTATTPSASVSLLNNVITGVGFLVVVAIFLGYVFNLSTIVLLVAIVGGITGATVLFQEQLNNLVSGVTLTVSKRLSPGDWVRLPSGIEGQIMDIQWDVTLVRPFANNLVVMPNKVMTEAELINYDHPSPWLTVSVPVGVHYSSDLAQVEQVTLEEANKIMHEINGDISIPDPVVRYNAFADSSINFNVVLRAKSYVDQFALKHEFIKRLHQRYNDEGIVIPFPIRTLDIPSNPPPDLVYQVQPPISPTEMQEV
jgi:small-conductance mechanosensitive channel